MKRTTTLMVEVTREGEPGGDAYCLVHCAFCDLRQMSEWEREWVSVQCRWWYIQVHKWGRTWVRRWSFAHLTIHSFLCSPLRLGSNFCAFGMIWSSIQIITPAWVATTKWSASLMRIKNSTIWYKLVWKLNWSVKHLEPNEMSFHFANEMTMTEWNQTSDTHLRC